MDLTTELLEKYNKPVPRYTSYPPANYFQEDYTSDDYIRAVKSSNSWKPQNISFYFHIPFCRKICHYCGCNTSPMAKADTIEAYVKAMKKEIDLICEHLDKSRNVSQIHFGGGTPNAISGRLLSELVEHIKNKFDFIEDAEIAIECNPACLDVEYVNSLKIAGFNRFSLGIQDFKVEVLKNINRDASAMPLDELIPLLKSGDEASVNLDFIYGLPGQSVVSFVQTIQKAIDLKPDRLVTFSYAHVPWVKKAQKILEKIGLPSADEKINMFVESNRLLRNNGYSPIGFDHYVLKSDELYKALENAELHRNFQGYCTRRTTGQVYAFGVSSISQLDNAYIQNTKSVKEYVEKINNGELPVIKGYNVSSSEAIVREVINELMCNKVIDWRVIGQRFNLTTEALKKYVTIDAEVLKGFSEDGILKFDDDKIEVSDEGMLFVRNVATSLDPLYKSQENQYSKSV